MEYWVSNASMALILVLVIYHIFTFSSKEFGVSIFKVGLITLIALANTITGERIPAIVWSATGLLFLLLIRMRMNNGQT